MIYYGDFKTGQTVQMTLNSFASAGESCTVTDLAAGDVYIYKDGGTTQRASSAGVTVTIDFDSITGGHILSIDLSDNTTVDFWQAGHDYSVRLVGITVDTKTLNPFIGSFSIENRAVSLDLTGIKGATFDTSTDSLEAIRNRGDAAWLTGGGGGGSSTVTLTVTDGTNPVADASVQIWNTGLSVLVSYATSNVSGVVTLTADDGSYTVKIRKAGYTWANQSLTVSGNTSATYAGTTTVIPATVDATLCRVYEYMRQPDGTFPATCLGYCKIVSLPYNYNTSIYAGTIITGTYAAATGLIYWDVPRGATVQFSISGYGYAYENGYTVPALASGRLSTL